MRARRLGCRPAGCRRSTEGGEAVELTPVAIEDLCCGRA